MYVLTQFNSASLNRHLTQTYNLSAPFGQGFVEVLAAQQTPDSPSWFEGTALYFFKEIENFGPI